MLNDFFSSVTREKTINFSLWRDCFVGTNICPSLLVSVNTQCEKDHEFKKNVNFLLHIKAIYLIQHILFSREYNSSEFACLKAYLNLYRMVFEEVLLSVTWLSLIISLCLNFQGKVRKWTLVGTYFKADNIMWITKTKRMRFYLLSKVFNRICCFLNMCTLFDERHLCSLKIN